MRSIFSQFLPMYRWQWPLPLDGTTGDDPEFDGDSEQQDPDKILGLSPCHFGWPANRPRSYTVRNPVLAKYMVFFFVLVIRDHNSYIHAINLGSSVQAWCIYKDKHSYSGTWTSQNLRHQCQVGRVKETQLSISNTNTDTDYRSDHTCLFHESN